MIDRQRVSALDAEMITIPRAEYELLRARAALSADLLDFGVTKAKPGDVLPPPLLARLVEGESPVRVWRIHRGLTLTELARSASTHGAVLGKSYLSQIETRKKRGSLSAMRALARALRVDLDQLAG